MGLSIRHIVPILLGLVLVAAPLLFPDRTPGQLHSNTTPRFEIAFDYQRQSGIASNQFAVWIENSSGEHVKTLYATRFTATGGWKRRPACLPEWVAAAQPDALSSREVDGITGATPTGGRLRYVWDGTDQSGRRVPPGTYRYLVEANLRWDNRIVCRGTAQLGGIPQKPQPTCEFIGDVGRERGMITNLAATYTP